MPRRSVCMNVDGVTDNVIKRFQYWIDFNWRVMDVLSLTVNSASNWRALRLSDSVFMKSSKKCFNIFSLLLLKLLPTVFSKI